MALSILNNISSLVSQNQLASTQANLQKTLFQLASGSRINSGADDAAGLAIADGLQANIVALTQAQRNANDGVGQMQVADGALSQVTTLLNRAVTLAAEASTGTVNSTQRVALDAEFTQIKKEIDRIGSNTIFNGTSVFSASTTSIFLSDSAASSSITVSVGALAASSIGVAGVATPAIPRSYSESSSVASGSTVLPSGNYFVQAYTNGASGWNAGELGPNQTLDSIVNFINAHTGDPDWVTASVVTDGNGAHLLIQSNTASPSNTFTVISGGFGGLTFNTVEAAPGSTTGSVNLTADSLLTDTGAQGTLSDINRAIAQVASLRGTVGAAINRLQAATSVMSNQVQNLSAAEDGIRSANVARAAADMSKYNILTQTGMAALAQANSGQQAILSLFR